MGKCEQGNSGLARERGMAEDGETDLVPMRTLGRRSYMCLQISTALDRRT